LFVSIKSYQGTFALTHFFNFNDTASTIQWDKDPEEIRENLYLILKERTKIMQGIAFGEIPLEEGEVRLTKLLEEPLLKADLNYLRQVLEYPTDIEEVLAMELGPVKNLIINKEDSILQFTSKVIWTLEDMNQVSKIELSYTFELRETPEGVYKLINYDLIPS
jgi:hypothetical protein